VLALRILATFAMPGHFPSARLGQPELDRRLARAARRRSHLGQNLVPANGGMTRPDFAFLNGRASPSDRPIWTAAFGLAESLLGF